jgi:hypothetical protein
MYALFGFIGGLIFLFATLMSQSNPDPAEHVPMIVGIAAPLYMPILYGALGFIGGYISAWVYNFIASRLGGIQIETQ